MWGWDSHSTSFSSSELETPLGYWKVLDLLKMRINPINIIIDIYIYKSFKEPLNINGLSDLFLDWLELLEGSPLLGT